jgi:hypothetical protein
LILLIDTDPIGTENSFRPRKFWKNNIERKFRISIEPGDIFSLRGKDDFKKRSKRPPILST